MPDPLAIWGAVTGTAGLGIALRQEIWSSRRSLRVERGWQYVFKHPEGKSPVLEDVYVYVMAWNTGRRPLHIEYAGFDFLVPGPRELATKSGYDLPEENDVWVNDRVEIALNGETFEVIPDGPSVKLWTRIGPILGLGIDPTMTLVTPYVVTVPEIHWPGSQGPLLARPPTNYDSPFVEHELARMALEYFAENGDPTPVTEPRITGVPRLIMEGDVERTKETLNLEGGTDSA